MSNTYGRTVGIAKPGMAVIVLIALAGCMTVRLDTGRVRAPVSMSPEVNRDYRVVRHFDRPLRGWFTLFDLVTAQNPKVEQAIEEELERSGGDAVVNLVIQGQDTFVDRLIPAAITVLGTVISSYGLSSGNIGTMIVGSLVTIGGSQVRVRTYTVSGDVVKYQG